MEIIKGMRFVNDRGIIMFNNKFDMTAIKLKYLIDPTPILIRAWQGHQIENIGLVSFRVVLKFKL